MTEKLYYDPSVKSCEATVLECVKAEDGYDILLDKTVIFPEGGGQLSDTGHIGPASVFHAREDGELIWHRADTALEAGTKVTVTFDEAPRADHSRQHSGEHILSGLAESMYSCHNVGFHMAADYVTIDLDRQLDSDQLRILELEANRAIERDEPTVFRMIKEDELESVELRKRAAGLKGDIRLVYVGGVDSCTCCGTHCARAGEIGMLKINAHTNYKGGTRIWFACGERAAKSMREDADIVDALSRRFSTKSENLIEAVIKQGDELNEARRALKARTEAWLSCRAKELAVGAETVSGTRLCVAAEDGLSMAELSILCDRLCADEARRSVALLFSAYDGGIIYRMLRSKASTLSMKDVCAATNALAGGKGGGRDDSAQGSSKASHNTEELALNMKNYLSSRLKGK